jgi:hypothetical protein
MGQLRVAEIEANAQLIWGTCCPAFPDQFRWFGLATLLVVIASYGERRRWRKRTKRSCRFLESLTMAKTLTHNPPSHEAMVKGRQISYQISNSRGSGHSPPYKV